MLTHPHISAGRVPTDRGYRVFVGDLMTRTEPTSKEKQEILDGLDSEPFALDRFLMATSRILSRLTGEVALVVAPDPAHFVLSAVHFARVAERKLLVVQVADTGLVESRLVETREDFTTRELEDAGRRLTVDFAGRSLWEIRRILVVALAEEKARFDAEVGKTLALGAIAFDGSAEAETRVFVEGTDTILDKPEFRTDVEALRRMFRALDEKVRLVNLVNDCLSSEPGGASVVIGSESPFTEEAGGAVVSAPYRRGERVVGALGVFGPRRMEYTRILPLVEELARYVTRRMTEGTI